MSPHRLNENRQAQARRGMTDAGSDVGIGLATAPREGRTSIVVADDHTLFRAGVRSLLEGQPGMRVVGEAATGREAIEQVRICEPDVVLMDLVMPELNGIEATRSIVKEFPDTAVVALSGKVGGPFIRQVLQAGASGYVVKTAVLDELIDAIRHVRSGHVYLSRAVTGTVVDDYVRHSNGSASESIYDTLTAREREVLQLVAEGYSTKVIASQLSVSVKTVETHRQAMMRKLSLPSVAHVTKYAVREGLTALDE